jgi:hypothetical protein
MLIFLRPMRFHVCTSTLDFIENSALATRERGMKRENWFLIKVSGVLMSICIMCNRTENKCDSSDEKRTRVRELNC